ncbi:MAG TPA: hypothetical protein VD905_01210 [Flavobacteriales bacterium]|nr:hypothetical protein [Flavobacteriales bacterium]
MHKTITKNGIECGFNYTNKVLRVWKAASDPHGPNNETSCTLEDIKVNNYTAKQCLGVVKANFEYSVYNDLLHMLAGEG